MDKMSEDEAIKKLQEMIGLCTEKPKHIAYNEKQAIETILDLYQKQKEKDLDYILNCMKEINNKLMNDLLNGKQKEKIKGLSEEG